MAVMQSLSVPPAHAARPGSHNSTHSEGGNDNAHVTAWSSQCVVCVVCHGEVVRQHQHGALDTRNTQARSSTHTLS